MQTKISANVAWELIAEHTQRLPASSKKLVDALGCFASQDIAAPISLPPFDNSAVDGYALGSAANHFSVVATIGAGECYQSSLGVGDACKIMTGAKIPDGTVCVAMQEDVNVDGASIELQRPCAVGENIRCAGEDVLAGTNVLSQGDKITPAHVGLLAALGIAEIAVLGRPTVAIVSTGSELVEPGMPREDGQVYYCTGPMLSALCTSVNASVHSVAKIADDKEAIVAALHEAKAADIVIMVGGMAQGLYDHGRYAFERVGVEPVFFEGQWRPGKPLFFGTLFNKPVFGLPGNPVAAFVMFKVFIAPAIERMSGGAGKLCWQKARVVGAVPRASDKSLFLRARSVEDGFELVAGQGSHQLYSLAQADAIVWVRSDEHELLVLSL